MMQRSTILDDWNDPRVVLAVTREGTLVRAAKALGVDHSTVFRRLNSLEKKLGTLLFERLPGGAYQLTSVGERMAAAAERMEDEALAFERDVAGRDRHSASCCVPEGSSRYRCRICYRQPYPQPFASRSRRRTAAPAPKRGRSLGPQNFRGRLGRLLRARLSGFEPL
jgi:molybdenum-dependent DNA-binding transcriptional regulator ModE